MAGQPHTVPKNPQAFVPRSKIVETINTGLFPHTAAAAAVKKVPLPVVSCNVPTILNEISSDVTLNALPISSKPVVIIGPSETVTPAVNDKISRMEILVRKDQFRGSLGESVGCGWRTN